MLLETYTASEHRFRFAAWTAGRAAGRGIVGFSGEAATSLLRGSWIENLAGVPSNLPCGLDFDQRHEIARQDLCERAAKIGFQKFSHGRAAKLLNVALKSIYLGDFGKTNPSLCNSQDQIDAIHPPIDRVLLDCLAQNASPPQNRTSWQSYSPWTNLSSSAYENLIADIRSATGGQLWMVEAYWQGHQ